MAVAQRRGAVTNELFHFRRHITGRTWAARGPRVRTSRDGRPLTHRLCVQIRHPCRHARPPAC